MQISTFHTVLARAKGDCKNIGQLVSVCRAELDLFQAVDRGDVLAARQALAELFQALGWTVSVRWLGQVTA